MVNGHYAEDYIYTELEFLTPTASYEQDGDFSRERNDSWRHNNVAHEDGKLSCLFFSTACLVRYLIIYFFNIIFCFIGIGEMNSTRSCDNIELNNQNVDKEETEISQLFAIGRHQLNKCLKCNKEVLITS